MTRGRPKKVKAKPSKYMTGVCVKCGDTTACFQETTGDYKLFEKCGNCMALEDIAKTKEPRYVVSLDFGGDRDYMGVGSTLLDALKAVPVPVKIVSKGLLKVTDGVKKFEQMWQPVKIKRLFMPLSQTIQAKMLNYLLR